MMNIEKIKQILVGIDKTETESINGWWPASYGAEFGEQVLKNLIDYIAPFTEELEKLRAENSYCKRLALDIASQKAVGEVTEINGVLGAVFYKGSELECGENIYAKPVSLLRNLEQSDTNVVATQLLEALQDMVDMYVSLVDSGDCGKGNPETGREVIKARAAIKAATDSDSHPLPAQQIQYSKAFSDGFKAGKEGDEDLLAHVLMHDEPAKHAPEESDKNLCALKTITDLQVKQVVRAFWRRIYPYRNGYERELPDQLPTEFFAHMATALSWVDKPLPYTEPAQQIQYQAACSGLWYETPKACGDIVAIKVDGEIYELSQQIPEGYVPVPIEPTPEMLNEINLTGTFSNRALTVRYKAMLSAIQSIPAQTPEAEAKSITGES